MNLLRGVGRLLLGGYFIASGVKAVRNPSDFEDAAKPLAEQVVPLVAKVLPDDYASLIPEDTTTLVRINGVASVIGGLGMATGIGSRGGATLAAASMVPHVLASAGKGPDASKTALFGNLALFGAALVVSQDTRGRPSLAWRADHKRQEIAKQAAATRKAAEARKVAQVKAARARKGLEGARR